jgi:hypothetical protein
MAAPQPPGSSKATNLCMVTMLAASNPNDTLLSVKAHPHQQLFKTTFVQEQPSSTALFICFSQQLCSTTLFNNCNVAIDSSVDPNKRKLWSTTLFNDFGYQPTPTM